jgi:signal peptidase I
MRPKVRATLDVVAVLGTAALVVWMVGMRWLPVSVQGESMSPALSPGDLAVVARTRSAAVGTIALFDSPRHGRVLHRVVSREADGSLRTRGDANPIEDLDTTPATSVVGPVVCVLRVGQTLQRWRAVAACATMAAQQNNAKR